MELIDVIRKDHDEVRTLFERVASSSGKRREDAFTKLRGELIRHEVAEEEIVRPLTKGFASNGKRIAEARIREESEAEGVLKKMERAEVGTPGWEQLFQRLHGAVLEHAEKEERVEHPRLAESVDREKLREAAKAFQAAKKLAPPGRTRGRRTPPRPTWRPARSRHSSTGRATRSKERWPTERRDAAPEVAAWTGPTGRRRSRPRDGSRSAGPLPPGARRP